MMEEKWKSSEPRGSMIKQKDETTFYLEIGDVTIEGFFTPQDAQVYNALVGRFKGGTIAEVGSWKGLSIASIMPTLIKNEYSNIFCIDTWKGSDNEQFEPDGSPGPHYEARQRDLLAEFKSNLKAAGYLERITPMQMTSLEAAQEFKDSTLDFVFIDADHTFEAVTKDIDAWLSKIKGGGILAGHDIRSEPVYWAVFSRFRAGYWNIAGNIWYVQVL